MNVSQATNMLVAVITSLCCTQLFADTNAYSPQQNYQENKSAPDVSTQTGWKQQNADMATQNAETEKLNADTAAENANTATQNANTAAKNANTAAQIVTPVPAPKDTTPVPSGYTSCFTVQDSWFNGEWVPAHRVCKYSPAKQGVAWIDGYWACTKYNVTNATQGACIKWDWKPGRWVNTFDVY